MYPFLANSGARRKKDRRLIHLLVVVIFLLTAALVAMGVTQRRRQDSSSAVVDALSARALSEADAAQSAVYRLTQSSGTNTMSLLSGIRSHVYALQCLNTLTASIYGADARICDPGLLETCTATLDLCETRLQAGNVLTTQFTDLRDQIDTVAAQFGL